MGNPGRLKFFNDEDSYTGTSAAILLRNIRPVRIKSDTLKLAKSEFIANLEMNLDGYRVKPRVTVLIECQLTQAQSENSRKRRLLERAMAGSPIIK